MAIKNFMPNAQQAAAGLPDYSSKAGLNRAFEMVRDELVRLEREIEELKKGQAQA